MKKFFTQTLMAIGLALSLVALLINNEILFLLLLLPFYFIGAFLAVPFVFSKNTTLQNVGYTLAAVAGAFGILILLMELGVYNENSSSSLTTQLPVDEESTISVGFILFAVGLIIMLVSVIIWLFTVFGFTRKTSNNIVDLLYQCKQMETEGALTADEFKAITNKVMKEGGAAVSFINDLKNWKKLLDQQVIGPDEFAAVKANLLQPTTN